MDKTLLQSNKSCLEDFQLIIFLISYGKNHLSDTIRIDYFAVSLPDLQIWVDDLDRRNRIHCNYFLARGYQGRGNFEKAAFNWGRVLEEDPPYEGVKGLGYNKPGSES